MNFYTMTEKECITIIVDHYGYVSDFGIITNESTIEQLREVAKAQYESTLN